MTMFSRSYALGLIFILLVAVLWAGASVLIQYIYEGLEFRSPFLLTYIANSLLALYLPLWQLWVLLGIVPPNQWYRKSTHDKDTADQKQISRISTDGIQDSMTVNMIDSASHRSSENSLDRCLLGESVRRRNDGDAVDSPKHTRSAISSPISRPITHSYSAEHLDEQIDTEDLEKMDNLKAALQYTHYDVLKMGAIVCPFWFLSNVLYNYSLYMTSVSSSTIISNLAASFTLTFSYWFGLEDVTKGKIFGIIICFIGAVCVTLKDSNTIDGDSGGDDDAPHHSFMGDIIALVSAMGYGMYTTLIRYLIPDDEGVSMQLLLGYIGLVNAVALGPVLIIMFYLKLENLASMTAIIFGFLTLNGLCNNVLSDYLWARSVVLTSPTVATIGLSITIPLAMISDYFIWRVIPTYLSGLGAFLVIVGFVLVNVTQEHEKSFMLWLRGGYSVLASSSPCDVDRAVSDQNHNDNQDTISNERGRDVHTAIVSGDRSP